jgi:3-phosphoshikimate 1-carboxyvinyltransferase
MTGHGVSYGAVSVMNAIPCGIGSTIGIGLRTEAEFDSAEQTDITLIDRPGMDTRLARTCVERTLEWIGRKMPGYVLTIESEIPPSMGLKSSSSVCNAVIESVLDYFGIVKDPVDVVKLGVECAKECKVTITGAFDDACGCHLGGLVITDNGRNELLSRTSIEDYDVVISVPDREIPKSKVPVESYRALSGRYEALVPELGSDCLKVLTENGRMVEDIVGGDGEVCKKAMEAGALATGMTGTGPAIAIIAKPGDGKRVSEALGGRTIVTKVRYSEITFNGGSIVGKVDVPPSKSYTHRAILMSALAGGRCVVSNPLDSFDTRATADAVRSMGAKVSEAENSLVVESDGLHAPDRTVDVKNSGTTMRLMTGIAALFDSETTIDGDDSIRKRPMGPLLEALEGCGVACGSNDGKAPITIKGPIKGDTVKIDGGMSSQFVSSMLMMSPLVGRPMHIVIEGKTVSRPYIDITTSMMRRFGITVQAVEDGFRVEPQRYVPCDYTVPSDFSSSAFPLVAGGLSGSVTVSGLDMDDPQGDKKIIDILRKAGCRIEVDGDTVTCSNRGRPKACDVDLSDIPDLFPIVAVLLSTAEGTSRLYGAPQLRFKESDRIASVEKMLRTLGADITGTDDGCVINGVERLKGGRIEHRGDHRLMMSAAIASLISDGPVTMTDDGCWNVSYPGFVEKMRSIGLRC